MAYEVFKLSRNHLRIVSWFLTRNGRLDWPDWIQNKHWKHKPISKIRGLRARSSHYKNKLPVCQIGNCLLNTYYATKIPRFSKSVESVKLLLYRRTDIWSVLDRTLALHGTTDFTIRALDHQYIRRPCFS